MVRAGINDFSTLNDAFINDLAANWYVLMLGFDEYCKSNNRVNVLIDSGILLKKYLRQGAFTFLDPMNVYMDTDLFFDIWLDVDGDIQFSELYGEAD